MSDKLILLGGIVEGKRGVAVVDQKDGARVITDGLQGQLFVSKPLGTKELAIQLGREILTQGTPDIYKGWKVA